MNVLSTKQPENIYIYMYSFFERRIEREREGGRDGVVSMQSGCCFVLEGNDGPLQQN